MSKVKTCELGDLIEFQRGYDLPKSEFRNGPYPVQSSNGILGYHIDYKVEGPGITIGRSGTVGIPHYLNENFYPHNTTLFYHLSSLSRYLMKNMLSSIVKIRKLFSFGLKLRVKRVYEINTLC